MGGNPPIPKHALDPCHDFMTRGIRGFVEVYDTRANVGLKIALIWCTSYGNRGEMTSTNEELVVVFQKQWPGAGVDGRCC